MQVVNRKERSNAKWRFAGLYLLSLAVPVLLIFNSIDMGQVENKDTSQLLDQQRKRDLALAELSQLAITLNTMQQLKPAFERAPEAVSKAKYEKLKYDFENGVNKLKQLYFSDTTLYNTNYKIVEALDYNYGEYIKVPGEFNDRLDVELNKAIAKNPQGGANTAQIIMLTKDLKDADKEIAKLKVELDKAASGNSGNTSRVTDETAQLRNKAEAMDKNIDGINVLLTGIEEDANKIQKKGDNNLEARKKILEKVQNLKSHTNNIKNSNDVLLSMIK